MIRETGEAPTLFNRSCEPLGTALRVPSMMRVGLSCSMEMGNITEELPYHLLPRIRVLDQVYFVRESNFQPPVKLW